MSVSTFEELTKGKKPERSLLEPMKKSGGRNNKGRMSIRHRGGGHKRMYRIIDWKRNKIGKSAATGCLPRLSTIRTRSSRIALLQYEDGEKRLHPWPRPLLKIEGTIVSSGPEAELAPGNALAPAGHPNGYRYSHATIELKPGSRRPDVPKRWRLGPGSLWRRMVTGRRSGCHEAARCAASWSSAWRRSARLGTLSTAR